MGLQIHDCKPVSFSDMNSNRTQKYCFLTLLLIFYLTSTALLQSISLKGLNGILVYPLDDTYIHMAMAKNLDQDKVWGLTKHNFSSSTSAPLWVLLLASAYYVFGISDWIPLLLNVLLGSFLIAVFFNYSLRLLSLPAAFTMTALFIFLVPLPSLSMLGMEHVLHILLVFLFFSMLVTSFSAFPAFVSRSSLLMFALCILLPMTRYESLFFVAAAALMVMAMSKRISMSLGLILSAAVPVMVYGVISLSHGFFLFPNSILLKGSWPNLLTMHDVINFSRLVLCPIIKHAQLSPESGSVS